MFYVKHLNSNHLVYTNLF